MLISVGFCSAGAADPLLVGRTSSANSLISLQIRGAVIQALISGKSLNLNSFLQTKKAIRENVFPPDFASHQTMRTPSSSPVRVVWALTVLERPRAPRALRTSSSVVDQSLLAPLKPKIIPSISPPNLSPLGSDWMIAVAGRTRTSSISSGRTWSASHGNRVRKALTSSGLE